MMTWTSGYVADLEYSRGVYREMAPGLLNLNLLMKQFQSEALAAPGKPVAYAELGCGHGLTAIMVAATCPQASVYATDFNPSHIVGARKLVEAAKLKNIHFFDHSFADFLEQDLPLFDVVALHGVYSWISEGNRALIREFLLRKLKPGGVCYISYNTLPGWSAAAPMRKLMFELGEGEKSKLMPARIDSAMGVLEKLQKSNAGYFKANPASAARFEHMQKQSRNYLAHEFMNRDWTLFYHCDVARELAEAKLGFVSSAHPLDHVDAVNLTVDQQQLLASVTDPEIRETVRDFCVNQQFRRDIFMKGGQQLSASEQVQALSAMRFALNSPRSALTLKAKFPVGEVNLQPEVYEPLADSLAQRPKTIAELLGEAPLKELGYQKIVQAIVIMVSIGHACTAYDDRHVREAKPHCDRLNNAFIERARYNADTPYLVSPVTGTSVQMDRFTQLMLFARQNNQPDLAGFVWQILSSQGQRLVKEGVTLEKPEQNLAELKVRVTEFEEKSLPFLKYLSIA